MTLEDPMQFKYTLWNLQETRTIKWEKAILALVLTGPVMLDLTLPEPQFGHLLYVDDSMNFMQLLCGNRTTNIYQVLSIMPSNQ